MRHIVATAKTLFMPDYSQNNLRDILFQALIAACVGAASAYASLFFLWAIDQLHQLLVGAKGEAFYTRLENIPVWQLFLLPVLGAITVRLIIQYGMPEQRHHGPADAIAAVRNGKGLLSIRAGIGSAAASIVSIGSGASVGRYGPAVHLGASLGSWFSQLLKLSPEQNKTLLACGVAGAISASFSAPLAGLVFAHEAILGRFGYRSIMPIAIASVVASTIAHIHDFDNIIFMLPEISITANWEYLLFALLGVIGGALAVLYMASMHQATQFAQNLPISAMARAALGGMILGGIIVIFPQTFGLGEHIIRDALHLQFAMSTLALLVLAKLLATSVSFAAGFSGGIFGPALFLGAMAGTAFGLAMHEATELTSSPAVYGVVGMGAVISRVIGAPITTILIVFELTGNYSLMTAVMVSVVAGGTVTRQLFNQSYFYHQLRMRGIAPETTATEQTLHEVPVSALTSNSFVKLTDTMTVSTARSQIIDHSSDTGYVVDSNNRLLGIVHASDLLAIDDKEQQSKPITGILITPPVVLTETMSVHTAYLKLKDFKGAAVPLVGDFETLQMRGIVYVSDLVSASLQAFKKNRENSD